MGCCSVPRASFVSCHRSNHPYSKRPLPVTAAIPWAQSRKPLHSATPRALIHHLRSTLGIEGRWPAEVSEGRRQTDAIDAERRRLNSGRPPVRSTLLSKRTRPTSSPLPAGEPGGADWYGRPGHIPRPGVSSASSPPSRSRITSISAAGMRRRCCRTDNRWGDRLVPDAVGRKRCWRERRPTLRASFSAAVSGTGHSVLQHPGRTS